MVCDGDIAVGFHGIHYLREEAVAWYSLHLEAVVHRHAYRHVLHHAQVVEEPQGDRVRFHPCFVYYPESFPPPFLRPFNDNSEVLKYPVHGTVEQSFRKLTSLRHIVIIIPQVLQLPQSQALLVSHQCVNNPHQPSKIPFVHA